MRSLALLVLFAIAATACGIWPDFPARDAGGIDVNLPDGPGGIDAADVSLGDGSRDAHDGGMAVDAADVPHDIGVDMGTDTGFPNCTVPSADAGFTVTPFASIPHAVNDLAFNAAGQLLAVGDTATLVDSTGATHDLSMSFAFSNALAVRWVSSNMAIVTSGSQPQLFFLTIDSSMYSASQTTVITSGFMYPGSVAPLILSGGMTIVFVSDSTGSAVFRVSPQLGTMNRVNFLSGFPLEPAGLALTPDGMNLFIANALPAPSSDTILALSLGSGGAAQGPPTMYTSQYFTGSSIAFDHCGHLYISDRDRSRILRVAPGGGTSPETLNLVLPPSDGGTAFQPTGMAFGVSQGGFDASSLYVVDSSAVTTTEIYRVQVGVAGAAVPGM